MKTTDAFTSGQSLIRTILQKMDGLNEWRRRFIIECFMMFLTIRGRINFLNLGRYGSYDEGTYRKGFQKDFDFMTFNSQLIDQFCTDHIILGFDPSYIPKSGKSTPGLGYFYSGCAGTYKKGLEIGCIAAIDVSKNTSFHIEAIQSPPSNKDKTAEGTSLVTHYADCIIERAAKLEKISSILVVDGYFAKRKFLDPTTEHTDLSIISRLRDDADLRYLYQGPKSKGRGRPKKYDGKVDVKNVDKKKVHLDYEDSSMRIYSARMYSVGLKRIIRVACVEYLDENGKVVATKFYFSTDVDIQGYDIVRYYRARFQMEFNFRDAKQYTGLTHCQARSEEKLYFHMNTSLTSVSIGKAIQLMVQKDDERLPLSIADVKTECFNRLLLEIIFSIYGIDPNIKKNNNMKIKVLNFGKIAA